MGSATNAKVVRNGNYGSLNKFPFLMSCIIFEFQVPFTTIITLKIKSAIISVIPIPFKKDLFAFNVLNTFLSLNNRSKEFSFPSKNVRGVYKLLSLFTTSLVAYPIPFAR